MELSETSTSARHILKSNGFNCTKIQTDLLELLIRAEYPVSREEILTVLKKDRPNTVTIYRILEKFCRKGIVHKAYVDSRAWKYELSDNCTKEQCHPHFKCISCGRVFCLHDVYIPLVKGLKSSFVFHRQKVMIEGVGPECSV